MDKKVSIIVPVYNVERYIRECVESLINQTYSNLEILLVDDGSTDNSGKICDEYAQQDLRIRVIHQPNGGAANAKNAGLDAATGDYIAFADSDDYVERNWIERLLDTAAETDADVVEYDFVKIYRTHTEAGNDASYRPGCFTAEEYLALYPNNWTCSLFWNKLFRADLVKEIRFRRERRCIDDEFFTYKVLSGAEKVVRIADVLYHYRQRRSGAVLSEKNRLQITEDAMEVLTERYDWIVQRFPKLRKLYLRHDIETLYCLARAHDFCEKTRKMFKTLAKFYLKESFFHFPGRITLQDAMNLRYTVSKHLPEKQITKSTGDEGIYYP